MRFPERLDEDVVVGDGLLDDGPERFQVGQVHHGMETLMERLHGVERFEPFADED